MKLIYTIKVAPLVLLIIGMLPIIIQAAELDGHFSVEDKKYIVDYSFNSTCSESLILNICYDFGHLLNFAAQEHTKIKQIDLNGDQYTVVYEYNYLFYRNRTTYLKTIEPRTNRINFYMLDFAQNISILPNVVESYGYYEVTSDAQGHAVRYFQETILDTELRGFYLTYVRSRTEDFLRKFEDYIRGFEDNSLR